MTSHIQEPTRNVTDHASQIRPFRSEDRAAIVAINNRNMPPHRQSTVAEWELWDSKRSGQEIYLRLVMGEPAIAYLDIVDLSTSRWRKDGVCRMELVVAHEHRRKGIGSALYERALAFAHERNANRIRTWFAEHTPEEAAISFLRKRGFVELEREQPSYLDLNAFDASRFDGVIKRVEQSGVRLFAYSELPDNEENRRKLYTLYTRLEDDMPQRDAQRSEHPPFQEWINLIMDIPQWTPEAVILAELDGAWVGVTQLAFQQDTNIGWTWITGVLSEYRGRNIATALKLRVIEVAQARNCPVITTENHADNSPMLAINRKLGFQPDIVSVCYVKQLREE